MATRGPHRPSRYTQVCEEGGQGGVVAAIAAFHQGFLLPFSELVHPLFWHTGSQLGTSFLSPPARGGGGMIVSGLWGVSPAGVCTLKVLPLGTVTPSAFTSCGWEMAIIRTPWKPSAEDGRVGASMGSLTLTVTGDRNHFCCSKLRVWVLHDSSLACLEPDQSRNIPEWHQRGR